MLCPVGSFLVMLLSGTPGAAAPTFHRDVEPILQRHCQDCHRPGQVAPFSLLDYAHARKRAEDLATVVGERRMPPWHASTEVGGPFKDARVLSAEEIATLSAWVDAGCPEGDSKEAPPPRRFSSDWPLGPPDLVLTVSEPFALGADGGDEFRVFVLPTGLTEGRWIKAVDFRPGNPKVVHHCLGAFDSRGIACKIDETDPAPGYRSFAGFGAEPDGTPFFPSGGLNGWAPGKLPRPLPAGVGRYLPAGADVLLQVHYHKSGKVERDASSIALYFSKEPIDKQVRAGMVFPPRSPLSFRPDLRIPLGSAAHEVRGELTVPYDLHLVGIIPHMHLIGKDFTLTARLPDGAERILIRVDRWDFAWQDGYELVEPLALPKGTVLRMLAHFDNSADNPANPSRPPIEVRWGEQTTNEMCIGFLQVTKDDEHLGGSPPQGPPLPINFEGRIGDRDRAMMLLRLRERMRRAAEEKKP